MTDFSFSPEERELLRAGRQERMPQALSQALRAGVDRQLTAAGSSTGAHAKLGAAHGLRLKIALWGTLGAVVIGSLSQVTWRRAEPAATQPTAAAEVAAPQPSAAAPAEPASTPAAPTADQLRLELELLEGVRAALARGASAQAAQLLERYAERFQRGTLRPESEALAIELDMHRGQAQAARRKAAQFLDAYPDHPLRERVRQLTR